jgi:hypothetical protein
MMTADHAVVEGSGQPICWQAETFDPKMASVRLRVLHPMSALKRLGYQVRKYRDGMSDCATIVFSKSDSPEALSIAEAASRQNRRIIYDVCDNIFEKPPADEQDRQRLERAKTIMRHASAVTCSTRSLAGLLTEVVPEIADKVEIIPDALEEADPSQGHSLLERVALWRLRLFLRRHRGALHLVWFGKCKKGYAGIEHLNPLVELIERLSLVRPVTLTVISNRRRLYRSSSRAWRIPKFYLPWSLATFDAALRMHEVAVIPVEANPYTIGKTINRPATALMAGLGVIADPIPAYEELRPFIFLGDWEGGLRHYSECPPETDQRIAAAQAHLRQFYSSDVITRQWVDVIEARDSIRRSTQTDH